MNELHHLTSTEISRSDVFKIEAIVLAGIFPQISMTMKSPDIFVLKIPLYFQTFQEKILIDLGKIFRDVNFVFRISSRIQVSCPFILKEFSSFIEAIPHLSAYKFYNNITGP